MNIGLKVKLASVFLVFLLGLSNCNSKASVASSKEMKPSQHPLSFPVQRSEADWKNQLNPQQYRILRESYTEAPHGKAYEDFKHQGSGVYRCAGCHTVLFRSSEKFDSGCGWPSFYDPAKAEHVIEKRDVSNGMVRTEVICAQCGGHLGHVFLGEKFPTPTDKRYCINAGGLEFVEDAVHP